MAQVKNAVYFVVTPALRAAFEGLDPDNAQFFVTFDGNDCFVLNNIYEAYQPSWEGTQPRFEDGFVASYVIPQTQRYSFRLEVREARKVKHEIMQAIINNAYTTPGVFELITCYDFQNPDRGSGNPDFSIRIGLIKELAVSSGLYRGKNPVYTSFSFTFSEINKRRS